MASIEILSGADAGTRIELPERIFIGRAADEPTEPEGFVPIHEADISREHACIRRNGSNYVIEDLNSTNGTYVGPLRLRPGSPAALSDGMTVRVATTRIVFHDDAGPRHDADRARQTPDRRDFNVTQVIDAGQIQRALREGEPAGDPARTLARLKAITRASIALGAVRQADELIDRTMEFLFDIFPPAERAIIMLRSSSGGGLYPVAECRRGEKPVREGNIAVSQTIVGLVVNNRQALLSVDARRDARIDRQASVRDLELRSVLSAPLLVENEVLGLIQVETSTHDCAFTGDDLDVLTGVCAQIGVTVKNLHLYQEIDHLLECFIRASVETIEARDPVTAGHSFRVADYTERLARAVDRDDRRALRTIRFSADQIRELRYAALLHDFGKVAVHEEILTKEKKLHRHQLDMLEQRFRYARACLEARAYRALAVRQEERGLDARAFRKERARIERELKQESDRLARFYDLVREANEPNVTHTAPSRLLKTLAEYRFMDVDGTETPLLQPVEHDGLTLSMGSLTPSERREVESHVSNTYRFLRMIPWTGNLAELPAIAHGHHEKLDGSGYPRGLSGEEIPIQTRMLTIADIFDALNSGDRPYKQAVPLEQSLDILNRESRAGRIDRMLFKVFVEARAYDTAGPAPH